MKTLLIVDDQKSARNGLKALLAQIPEFEVVGEATNGQEAIQSVAANLPDIVLMDVKMPIIDGFTATRHIKKLGLPVKVVLTSMIVNRETEALAAGADAFVSKNESPERLLAVLESLDIEEETEALPKKDSST
jgi:DNA-binding NarL/FixJ family response regulator